MVSRKGEAIATWFELRFSHLSKNMGRRFAQKIREFGGGLNTIHNPLSLLLLILVSMAMWYVIALAYHEVTIAYHGVTDIFGDQPLDIPVPQILLLMGSSMVGSILQLPGVGGGSQLATIAALEHIFDVPKELALSCGIMLWLVTFVAVVPLGQIRDALDQAEERPAGEDAGRRASQPRRRLRSHGAVGHKPKH